MKIMNTVFTDHLGVETRSSFQSQCHAIETLAMQPRRAAEEPNSQSVSPVVRRRQRKYTRSLPPPNIILVTSRPSRKRSWRSLLPPSEQSVLVGSNAVVDGADNEQSVLVGSTAAAVAVNDGANRVGGVECRGRRSR